MKQFSLTISFLLSFMLLIPTLLLGQTVNSKKFSEAEDYRRSSLCLMLITHQGDRYARDIEEQFKAMPLPSRYNSLNIDVRVINTNNKVTDKMVSSVLKERGVAKELVGKWFNRDYNGVMNMNRIHDWGGYNATYADLKRAQDSERGVAMLSDEGSELIKNTFVLVCDISYYDRSNTGNWLSAFMQVGAAYLDATAQQQAEKGNATNASTYSNLALAASAGSVAAADIAGFSVNVVARLYRLNWSDKLRDKLYRQYWIDETTPSTEAQSKKASFDRDDKSYTLEYLGSYRSRSGKTVSKSANNLNQVIRIVCAEAVDQSMNNLAKMFPVFKPKTPFYCENDNIYAYIGTKEGVNSKSKFEVLETKKTKKGIEYNRVAKASPLRLWRNDGLYIAQDSLIQQYKGTQFMRTSGKKDICDQGFLLREMGKMGYQYKKRHRIYADLIVGMPNISESTLKKEIPSYQKNKNARDIKCEGMVYGYEVGWMINSTTCFAWNPINIGMVFGGDALMTFARTGCILRTPPVGSHGKFALFVWPSIGAHIGYTEFKYTVNEQKSYRTSYRDYRGRTQYRTEYYYAPATESRSTSNLGIFDWNVKAGITLGERISLGVSYGNLYYSGMLSIYF